MSRLARRLQRRYAALFRDPIGRAFFGDSGYANYGYWTADTTSAAAACDQLVDRLLAHLPRPPARVLDVACGHGGTTQRLARAFGAHAIVAVDLVPAHVAATAARTPGCRHAVMDAARLGFADASFDVVLCTEAAFHFETRERFLREAARVLRPGGHLLLADLILRAGAGRVPRANLVRSMAAYRELLLRCGFHSAELEDITDKSWRAFRRRYAAFAVRQRGLLVGTRRAIGWLLFHSWRGLLTEYAIARYFLAVARKAP
ncbi:MAG TPA: methyltransferase domain-containing protein [Planctomycetota bacterium]|nr:methyltransferase domain-containing protein [Planctomycetota bacterium]